KLSFTLRLYDAKGRLIREEQPSAAKWTLEQLAGSVGPDGVYVAPAASTAGFVKASIGSVTGQARVRVVEPLPWTFDFEKPAGEGPLPWWTGAPGKVFQRSVENVGNVLVRPRDDT